MSIKKNQTGLVITLLIICVAVIFAYLAIQSFLKSDQGQKIQNTTDKVLDTIEGSSTDDKDKNLIQRITQ